MKDYHPSVEAYLTIMAVLILILALVVWLTFKVDVWGLT